MSKKKKKKKKKGRVTQQGFVSCNSTSVPNYKIIQALMTEILQYRQRTNVEKLFFFHMSIIKYTNRR